MITQSGNPSLRKGHGLDLVPQSPHTEGSPSMKLLVEGDNLKKGPHWEVYWGASHSILVSSSSLLLHTVPSIVRCELNLGTKATGPANTDRDLLS